MDRFSSPDELVVNLFLGTFATVNTCLELPRHGRFVGCGAGTEHFSGSRAALVDTFSRQIQAGNSDISPTFGMLAAWKIAVRSLDRF